MSTQVTPHEFRAWTGQHMAYQGEPDLETLPSFMHHYSNCPLMLFTGSVDSNGRKVYEGDIVRMWIEDMTEDAKGFWWIAEVAYEKSAFRLKQVGFDYINEDAMLVHELIEHCEVIGNIYEPTKTNS